MIHGSKNKPVLEHFTVSDVSGNRISNLDETSFTVFIYDPDGYEVSANVSVSIANLGEGNYRLTFTPDKNGTWYVVVIHDTYFPWGKVDDVYVTETDLTEIYNIVIRTLGLVHHNFYIDNPVYDEFGNLISARVRIYSQASSVGTDNDVIETYLITSSGIDSGKFDFWKQVAV